MITTQEIKHFKRQLKNGILAGEIKNNMLEQGFSKADIDKVFIANAANMKSWYLFFGCAFVLAAITFLTFIYHLVYLLVLSMK